MKQLNWAVIGCGVISKSHLEPVANSGKVKLYAVCDSNEAAASEVAEKFGCDKIYTDYRELLCDPEVDVVSVCTPSGMHGEMVIEAAKHKKHILCEKPMEITKEKIDAMIQAAKENGVKLGCVFQRRTYPEAVAARKFVEENNLGPIVYAEARAKYFRSREYYKSADWRATWELDGGGCLMNQGVHAIDLLCWMVGDVKSVFARCETLTHDIQVEDTASAVVEFTSGALGIIQGSTNTYPSQDTKITLYFENGTLWFGDEGIGGEFSDPNLVIPELKSFESNVKEDPTAIGNMTHKVLVEDLADAILENRDPMISPEDGRKSVELILAIYESARKKQLITINE